MSTFRALLPFVLSAVALTACNSSKVNGTVDGEEFGKVGSAIFMQSSSNLEEVQIVLTNYTEACVTYTGYFQLGSTPSEALPLNALFIRFLLTDPVSPQSYDIVPPTDFYPDWLQWVHAWYRTYSETGWDGPDATGGSITVDSIDESVMTGSFSVELSTGDTLDGDFTADFCNAEI